MSTAHGLHKRIDRDLLARVLNKVPRPVPAMTRQKPPRRADTYRGARRNAVLRGEVKGVWKGIKPYTMPRIDLGTPE